MPDKVTASDNPAAKIWGESPPGKVLWDEVTAPENTALLDGDERARKLEDKELRDIQRKLKRVTDALAVWDFKSYPQRLRYYRYRALKARTSAERNKWRQQFTEAKQNPPPAPKKPSWLTRLFSRFKAAPLVIRNEREAQKSRLWVDRIQKRLKEHNTAIANQAIYDALAREMQMEVAYFARRLVDRWTALQHREEYYVNGKRRIRRVRIQEAIYTEDRIQYKIFVSSRTLIGANHHVLPDGVAAWDLVKPDTLSELTAACERPVGSPHEENTPESFQNGAWVYIDREGLTDGLFSVVDYSTVIAKYDVDKRHRFPVPIGVMQGRVLEWLYLDEHPHLMVNGISGSGKTNAIRVALTTWAQYHSPDEIRFYLVDLKRGGDFRRFANVPHLAAPVMTKIAEMEMVMPQLVALMYHRMDLFAQHAVRDIIDYNKRFETKLERIVIVIDECSAIKSLAGKEARETIWQALTLISTQARAAGIHLLLGTQQSFADAIPASVRDNITFLLSGRQRTLAASMGSFGNGRAKRLAKIRGRMICDNGGDTFQVQTPYVSQDDEDKAVSIAMQYGEYTTIELPTALSELPALETTTDLQGAAPARVRTFGIEDVARLAITKFNGVLSRDKIYALDEVPKTMTTARIAEMIKEIAALDILEIDDEIYEVSAYRKGWQLIKTEDQTNTSSGDQAYELSEAGD